MIVFINPTGHDADWQASAVHNAVAVAVYLTDDDKAAIADMDDNTRMLVESRQGIPPARRAAWAARMREFGDRYYRKAIATVLGIKGGN